MKRALVVVAATATLSTSFAVATASPSGPTARAASSISWGKCTDPDLSSASAQCAMLSVPLDYAHPSGKKIKLAISRVQHTSSAADYQGVILVNPGGPGGSGLSLSTLGQYVPKGAGGDYDWIGFDPRGVGSSQPAMHCDGNYFHTNRPDYRPTSQHNVDLWLARSKKYADTCAAKYPALIKHMTTIDAARDMNQIRIALGVNQISYYGFSYGTYVGEVFSTLYPARVKRMVLDSNVNPKRVWYQANLDQDRAFDRNSAIWFKWVAKYHGSFHLGSTEKAVHDLYYKELNKLAAHPAGGQLGPDEWSDAFLYAGYYRFFWVELGQMFANFVHHNSWKPLVRFFKLVSSTGDDNGFAVYAAVQCSDASWPRSWSTWKADNTRVNAKHPFLTWGNAWFNAPCLYWKAPMHTPLQISGARVPSVLLIDETLDAATPFSGSLVVRKLYPHSSLLAEPGGATHADSLSGDACVDNAVATYLATGKRPPRQRWNGPDALCKPLPDPVPPKASSHHSVRPAVRPQITPLLRLQ